MCTRVRQCAGATLLPDEQHVKIARPSSAHGAVRKVGARQHGRERLGLVDGRMCHADSFAVDEIAAEIRAGCRQADARDREGLSSAAIVASAQNVGGRH